MEFNSESEDEIENRVTQQKIKKNYRNYSKESLQQALNEIKNEKTSIYTAAKKYSIPSATLFKRLKNGNLKKSGRSSVLSADIEKELADWLITSAQLGDPKTTEELLSAAAELAKLSPDEKKHFKSEIPSRTWLKGFLSRNPRVSFRTPSTVSRASANVSAKDIINYINGVHNYLEKKNLLHVLNEPTAWGNSDETGIELNAVPRTVLAAKGAKNVYRVETARPKERVSVMYTFLASGEMLTPQMILKESTSTITDIAFACGGKEIFFNKH
jgi:transposase-like protein